MLHPGRARATKADFPSIEKLFVTCRKSGDLPLDICAEDEARAAEHIEKVTEENSEEFVRGWIEYVRDDACDNYNPISLWDESEYYCEMWVEKIDLKSLFSNICKRYTILCRVKHLNWWELNWPELPIRHPNQLWRHD